MSQRIGAWLAAWASAVVAWPRLIAAATLALGALAAWYAADNLGVNTDTANMISPTIPWRQHYNEYRDAFPLRDRNLAVVIDAPTPQRADDSGGGEPAMHLAAPFGKLVGNNLGGALLLKPDLRMGMDVAADRRPPRAVAQAQQREQHQLLELADERRVVVLNMFHYVKYIDQKS